MKYTLRLHIKSEVGLRYEILLVSSPGYIFFSIIWLMLLSRVYLFLLTEQFRFKGLDKGPNSSCLVVLEFELKIF